MNDIQMTASLAWLLYHAEQGRTPDHVTDEGRLYAIDFLTAAIAHSSSAEDPKQLAVITHGHVEGEYRAKD